MRNLVNPFHEVYAGETVSPEKFADLFSPFLVPHASLVFRPGNVLLVGAQGSGKTMLLRLMNNDVRIAYRRKESAYPVAKIASEDFVPCGINIMRSPAIDFGQRSAPKRSSHEQAEILPLYFGDFLNCWLISDLVKSVRELWQAKVDGFLPEQSVNCSTKVLADCVEALRFDEVLKGLASDTESLESFQEKLTKRIRAYSDYFAFNRDDLPQDIETGKTTPGFALSQFAAIIRAVGMIGPETTVFARLDQCDDILRVKPTELTQDETNLREHVFLGFGEVINKMIGLRDPNISYRLAVRPSSVRAGMRIFGTQSDVESYRNYKAFDIDDLLLRKENAKSHVTPGFFKDVLRRRLELSGYVIGPRADCLKALFGEQLPPERKVERYLRNSAKSLPSLYTDGLSESTRLELAKLLPASPMDWRFGAAWMLQHLKPSKNAAETVAEKPWRKKVWWIKERTQQCLLQLAAANRQRMIWAGDDDIIQVAGNGVLPFIQICQEVWERWLRTATPEIAQERSIPEIPHAIQFEAIQAASMDWHRKLRVENGADYVMPFADVVALDLRRRLRSDTSMSYPGANGFSLTEEDIEENEDVRRVLTACVDFGILVSLPHTTRYSGGKKRQKFYFSPILSPIYQLPHTRTKEPRYVTAQFVRDWMVEAKIGKEAIARASVTQSQPLSAPTSQTGLFDSE